MVQSHVGRQCAARPASVEVEVLLVAVALLLEVSSAGQMLLPWPFVMVDLVAFVVEVLPVLLAAQSSASEVQVVLVAVPAA